MVLSVVINFVEIVSKSKCQQKYLGMSQNEELWSLKLSQLHLLFY